MYAYKDKRREAKRVQELSTKKCNGADQEQQRLRKDHREKKKKNEAWSSKAQQREQRDQRREKKGRKRAWAKAAQATATSGKQDVDRDDDTDGVEDWEELKREDRLLKKAKRTGFVTSSV